MTICGLPLSVDDSAVLEMLEKYKVGLKSEIKYERIRNPVTHRMTTVLNGNRFVYTEPLPPNTSLPRFVHCAGLKCRLYHHGQETVTSQIQCFNCWEMGHRKNNCRKAKACRVCHKEGHEPGSPECEHYSTSENIVAFQGKDNPISNFYPCEIKVFGEVHQSAEHAIWIRPIQNQPLQKQPLTSIGVQDWTSQEQLGPIRQNGRVRTNWGL